MRSIHAAAAVTGAALLCAGLSTGLVADDTPPTELHWVDGHWTAWTPPRDIPAGTPLHIVVRGDTLWDLAASNFGNPYLWPQIWEKNQYILDAHWIYPGDPIVLGVEVETLDPTEIAGRRRSGAGAGAGGASVAGGAVGGTRGVGGAGRASGAGTDDPSGGGEDGFGEDAAAGTAGEDAVAGPVGGYAANGELAATGEAGAGIGAGLAAEDSLDGLDIDTVAEATSGPQAFGFESDLYCSGYIGELEEALPIAIAGSEHQAYGPSLAGQAHPGSGRGRWGDLETIKYGLDLGDIVYLDGGRSEGLAPGDVLAAIQARDKVRHPLTNDTLGRYYGYLGRVRVLTVDAESAIAEISHVCDPIPVGSRLAPFRPEPVPLGRRTASRPANDPSPESALESAPVIVLARDGVLSLGEDHLVFIDRGAEDDATPGDVYTIYRLNREGFPPLPVGELAVLSVARRTSLARILSSRLPIFIGDRLERK